MNRKRTQTSNTALRDAKKAKADEFYTQLDDIEKEVWHYKDQFKGKVVYCNCDDPFESNFFKYFALRFNRLGLKKLMATSYSGSPIAGTLLPFADIAGAEEKKSCLIEIHEVVDVDNDGKKDMIDVELLLRQDKNLSKPLEANGDFRSNECIEFLKEADIVVTNPPFSLFREYVVQLVKYDKHFLILGSQNAITYKEIFPLIRDNKLWLGYENGGTKWFQVPDDYEINTETRKKIIEGVKYFSMGNELVHKFGYHQKT